MKLFGNIENFITVGRRRRINAVYTFITYKYRCIPDKWPGEAIEEAQRMLRDVDTYVGENLVQFFIRERKAGRLPALLRVKDEPRYTQLLLFEDE